MAERREPGEGGVLLLDKPAGWSSTRALGRAKRLLAHRKAGHTGTLDPFATGLLPLVFGEATKFSRFLIDAPKTYLATLGLGRTSSTGDPEGELSPKIPVRVERPKIEEVLAGFMGVQQQVPPMHSALRQQGKRLYELARAGIEVERAPRTVEISRLDLLQIVDDNLVISVKCSKGTYVRTLAQDIGARLGCGAYLTALRRTEVGGFRMQQAVTLEVLEAAGKRAWDLLLPLEATVATLRRTDLGEREAEALGHGRSVEIPGLPEGETALFAPGSRFLGVGLAGPGGRLLPVRLLASVQVRDSPDFA